MPTTEELARGTIDALLTAAGWAVQDYRAYNPSVATGIALREVPLMEGRCDYLLMLDRAAVGIIEAKKEGVLLSGVAEQSAFYAGQLPPFLQAKAKLRFCYESTGIETYFRDTQDPHPRSRQIFAFHKPETLAEWARQAETLRARLCKLPPLITTGMRDCQIEAVTKLEKSLAADKPRALIQMATGAGKTYTACAFTYRLIKHAGARRVLSWWTAPISPGKPSPSSSSTSCRTAIASSRSSITSRT